MERAVLVPALGRVLAARQAPERQGLAVEGSRESSSLSWAFTERETSRGRFSDMPKAAENGRVKARAESSSQWSPPFKLPTRCCPVERGISSPHQEVWHFIACSICQKC